MLIALAALSMVTVVAPSATADDEHRWYGHFTYARVDDASPVLGASTTVRFGVSPELKDARIQIYRGDSYVRGCTGGSECAVGANPPSGVSETYRAKLMVVRDGEWVDYAWSDTVTVTDPGWNGVFEYATVDDASPVLGASTTVRFGVSPELKDARIQIYRGDSYVRGCTGGSECAVGANPPSGVSETYRAKLMVVRDGEWVDYAWSDTVTVTDPGWNGEFIEETVSSSKLVSGDTATATFGIDEPLSSGALIRIVDDSGDVRVTCSADGATSCSTSVTPAEGATVSLHAEAVVQLAGGASYVVATSGPVSTHSMTTDELAEFVLAADEPALEAALGVALLPAALSAQSAATTEALCVGLGFYIRTYLNGSSVPDITLVCYSSKVRALALLLAEFGVSGALAAWNDAGDEPDIENPIEEPTPGEGEGDGPDDPNPPGPPAYDGWRCEAPDGTEYTLSIYQFYSKIVGDHFDPAKAPIKSQFSDEIFESESDIADLICEALRSEPVLSGHSMTNPDNYALLYDLGSPIGTDISTGGTSSLLTVLVEQDGSTVFNSFPGWVEVIP